MRQMRSLCLRDTTVAKHHHQQRYQRHQRDSWGFNGCRVQMWRQQTDAVCRWWRRRGSGVVAVVAAAVVVVLHCVFGL